ncbi:MAG TPA: hypothetical protein VFE50_06765 [Cyclobacteriaceae bacterium]|nr:hypothetical protein [Cyclobacteriaceae bacterium]
MRFLNSIDLTAQTVLLVFCIVTTVIGIFVDDFILFTMFGALILGPWQLLSSILGVWTKVVFWNQRKLHLILTTIYAVGIGIGAALADYVSNKFALGSYFVFAVATPSGLAVFYYIITYKTYRSGKLMLV